MEVGNRDEETEWEVGEFFIDLVDFLDLVGQVLKGLELRFTFWSNGLFCVSNDKGLSLPSLLDASYELNFV